ncbi:MAG: Ig-like domain-containing protein, partial [Gemmatimonadales bacterium]|nr:Ig-like domain-containing protein [Gemmatimonadales bacterium]
MRLIGPLAWLLLLSCARMEPPPGGPPDTAPPRLIATLPDSLALVPGFDDDAEFRFDEVISEGGSPSQGTGTGDLERLVILSPSAAVPEVSWRRSRITVRPDEGWRPDRVYRVELLPGVTDLRRNRSTEGAVITFTTGAPAPQARLEGVVVDWGANRPAPAALVVATLLPDSLAYRGLADSSGRFSLGPLPAGEYVVSGVLDENRNFRGDSREAYDTARVRSGTTAVGELWAFVHDTAPPRIRTVTVTDSVSATVELTQNLHPSQRLGASAATLRLLPDSTPVQVLSVLPKSVDDSLHQRAAVIPDSAAPADSIGGVEPDSQAPARPGAGARPRRPERAGP